MDLESPALPFRPRARVFIDDVQVTGSRSFIGRSAARLVRRTRFYRVFLRGLAALLLLALPGGARAEPPRQGQLRAAVSADPWWGRDKKLHFAASGGLALAGYGTAALADRSEPVRLAVGAGLALGAGLGKEGLDLFTAGDASRRDLAWDLAGTASGLLLAWAADRVIRLLDRPSRGEGAGVGAAASARRDRGSDGTWPDPGVRTHPARSKPPGTPPRTRPARPGSAAFLLPAPAGPPRE